MVTADELKRRLVSENETRDFEVKGPGLRSDSAFRAKVARAVMAMGNLRGGGQVCIGIDANRMAAMEPGLDATELAEWSSFDDVTQDLARYSDPPVTFTVHPVTVGSGRTVVVLDVEEFDDVPHICQRSYGDTLHSGFIYVRPRGKPQSLAVSTHVAMRELIDIAVMKRQRQMSERRAYDEVPSVLPGPPAPPPTMTQRLPLYGLDQTYRGFLPGRFSDGGTHRSGLHLRAVWVPWWCEEAPQRFSRPRRLEPLVPEDLMESWISYYSRHGLSGGLWPAAPVPELVNGSAIVVDRTVALSESSRPDLAARVGVALVGDTRLPRFLADLVLRAPGDKFLLADLLRSLRGLARVVSSEFPAWFDAEFHAKTTAGGTLELHAQGLTPDSVPSELANLDRVVDLTTFGEPSGTHRVALGDAFYLDRVDDPVAVQAIATAFADAAINWGYLDGPEDLDQRLAGLCS